MTDLTPMLASIGSGLPVGGSWVFEPKYDGIRILAFAADSRVRLVSRNGLDKTRQFPEVAEAVLALSKRKKRQFIVDGEIVVMRGDTPARFQELQSRMTARRPSEATTIAKPMLPPQKCASEKSPPRNRSITIDQVIAGIGGVDCRTSLRRKKLRAKPL